MKWEKRDINGLLISKDLIEPIEYTLSSKLKYTTPDKRWISETALGDISWLWMSEPNKILSGCKSSLKGAQLKDAGRRINERLSENVWSKYKMPEVDKYSQWFGVPFIRLYRARRNKSVKVLTKNESCVLLGRFDKEQEFDIFKIIQWISEWDKETSVYEEDKDKFCKYCKALIEYGDKEKLFNMHFGDEYTDKDKKNFTNILHDIYNYVKAESPLIISIAMLKGKKNNIVLEANI
jgi:hypothetical protein